VNRLEEEERESAEEVVSAGSVVETKGIGKEFNGIYVLKDIDFDLRPGEIHSVVGQNGAGKSTFIKILTGLYPPSEGEIRVNGSVVALNGVKRSEAYGIMTVQQEINTVPFFNVYENIFIGSEEVKRRFGMSILDDRKMKEKTTSVMKRLGVNVDPDTPVFSLNALAKRIIEISKALVHEAKILIFDEPTTSLGQEEKEKLLSVIKGLKENGLSIIFVSHNLDEVLSISDRITVLRDGHKIGTLDRRDATIEDIVSMMLGNKQYAERKQRDSYISNEIVLDVDNVCTEKLKNVSFNVHKGEILGIAGAVGAGKTEIVRAIYGLDGIVTGKLTLYGKRYVPTPERSVKNGIAFVPEERRAQGLVLGYSVAKNLTLAYLDKWCRAGVIDERAEANVTNEYCSKLAIKATGSQEVVDLLSGGNQQKVVIARWLSGNFKLGFFDEPTIGIDIKAKQDIYDLFVECAKAGKSIVFLSSYVPELLGICDRILVMRGDQFVGEFKPEEEDVESKITIACLGGGTAS